MSRRSKILSRITDRDYPAIRAQFKAVENPGLIRNFLAEILTRPAMVDPTIEVPLKHIRLQQLEDAGFNTVDRRYYLRGQLSLDENIDDLKKLLGLYKKVSCRNYKEEKYGEPSPRLPVLYDTGQWPIIKSFCLTNNYAYHTLVNQALKLEDTVCSGNLVLCDSETFLVSITEGYGTPRFVDEKDAKLKLFMGEFGNPLPDWTPPFITSMAESLRNFLPDIRPMTIEFSIYPYEVGQLKRKEVLWEWRGGVEQDIKVMAAHYLTHSSSFEMIMRVPLRGR